MKILNIKVKNNEQCLQIVFIIEFTSFGYYIRNLQGKFGQCVQ